VSRDYAAGVAAHERLLKPAEAAALAGISARALYQRAHRGRLACVTTPGGTRRYRAADVLALKWRRNRKAANRA
jgi:predicted site-specific integrase-resolvase